jgi:hypothetical protein
VDDRTIAFDDAVSGEGTPLALSPPIDVIPGRECIFETAVTLERGRLLIHAVWPAQDRSRVHQIVTEPELASFGRTRVMLRVVPQASPMSIEIASFSPAGEPVAGRIEPLRLLADR